MLSEKSGQGARVIASPNRRLRLNGRNRRNALSYVHNTLIDPERYQTVYGMQEGSVAAPTAGRCIELEEITTEVKLASLNLNVGWEPLGR